VLKAGVKIPAIVAMVINLFCFCASLSC